jgi:hypothetical protein
VVMHRDLGLGLETCNYSQVILTIIARSSRGMCSFARVSTALGVKHLIAQFGLTFTSTCLGQE